jgi:quinol monooxygenase YgiN
MYAVVFQVEMKQGWQGDVDAELDRLVSMVKSVPGFVRGTWASDGTKGFSFIVMEDEASARELAGNAGAPPDASVTFNSVDVLEIARDV